MNRPAELPPQANEAVNFRPTIVRNAGAGELLVDTLDRA